MESSSSAHALASAIVATVAAAKVANAAKSEGEMQQWAVATAVEAHPGGVRQLLAPCGPELRVAPLCGRRPRRPRSTASGHFCVQHQYEA
mmetsp:Transcript_79361/g.246392  ORF Transcript_79361/g.246392 Transcript_79361/m.246392 type:complete len:90 (-) Transcript_79361:475-744(-)